MPGKFNWRPSHSGVGAAFTRSHELSAHAAEVVYALRLLHAGLVEGLGLLSASWYAREEGVSPDSLELVKLRSLLLPLLEGLILLACMISTSIITCWQLGWVCLHALVVNYLNIGRILHTRARLGSVAVHLRLVLWMLLVVVRLLHLRLRLIGSLIDWLWVVHHVAWLLLRLGLLRLQLGHSVLNSICNSLLKHLLQILLRVHLLELFKLTIAHDSLADIESVHVTAIAAVSEAEVEVVAVEAHPVTNPLGEHPLRVGVDAGLTDYAQVWTVVLVEAALAV